jgi:hypothetical protein
VTEGVDACFRGTRQDSGTDDFYWHVLFGSCAPH